MANEFGHTTNAPNAQKCTKDNWEDTAKHAADSQAANDMLYCDGTYWKRATRAAILALLSGQAGADFSMNTNKLTSVKDPTAAQDAATKKYIDDHAADADAHGEPTITTDDGVVTADDKAFSVVGGAGIDTSGATSVVTVVQAAASDPAQILTIRGDTMFRGASVPERRAKGTQYDALIQGANVPYWTALPALLKFGGGAPANIRDLLFEYPVRHIREWANLDGWTDASTGDAAEPLLTFVRLPTGATQNRTGHIYGAAGVYLYRGTAKGRQRIGFRFQIVASNATEDKVDVWMGFFKTPATPSTTQEHVAFHVANGSADILWSSGDGSTEETGDTGKNLAEGITYDAFIKTMESNVYFYIDGALVGTASTNLPDNDWQIPCFFIENTGTATDEKLMIYPLQMMAGPD